MENHGHEKDNKDDNNNNDRNYQGKQDYPFNLSTEKKKTGHVWSKCFPSLLEPTVSIGKGSSCVEKSSRGVPPKSSVQNPAFLGSSCSIWLSFYS